MPVRSRVRQQRSALPGHAVRREVAHHESTRWIGGSADVVERCFRSVLGWPVPTLTCVVRLRSARFEAQGKARGLLFHPSAYARRLANSGAGAAGRARFVRAPSASVRERCCGSAGGRRGAGAHGGVHGPVGAVVDRRPASAGAVAGTDAQRDVGGRGAVLSRSGPRATRWQGALRSSSWRTGSLRRGWRRRISSRRLSGGG